MATHLWMLATHYSSPLDDNHCDGYPPLGVVSTPNPRITLPSNLQPTPYFWMLVSSLLPTSVSVPVTESLVWESCVWTSAKIFIYWMICGTTPKPPPLCGGVGGARPAPSLRLPAAYVSGSGPGSQSESGPMASRERPTHSVNSFECSLVKNPADAYTV